MITKSCGPRDSGELLDLQPGYGRYGRSEPQPPAG